MKRFVFLFTILTLISVSFSSCDDALNRSEPKYTTRTEAFQVLGNYLELFNDKYVFNISQEEAVEIGVSVEMFVIAQNEVRSANNLINELRNEPNHEVILTNSK